METTEEASITIKAAEMKCLKQTADKIKHDKIRKEQLRPMPLQYSTVQ